MGIFSLLFGGLQQKHVDTKSSYYRMSPNYQALPFLLMAGIADSQSITD